MTTTTETAVKKCPYCYKPIETPVARVIFDRGYDPHRRKQYLRERNMEFCSTTCGANYQMGSEG